jgi:hypothetical protein
MRIEKEDVNTAYRKLKRMVYYDKTNLRLRHQLADFEGSTRFTDRLLAVGKVVNSDDPLKERSFKRWLSEIEFRVVPKSFEKKVSSQYADSDTGGKFITNVTSAKVFSVERVNYFFDGPVELHLIAVLWIMFEGRVLDSQLGPECYGSRLEAGLESPHEQSAVLFRKYHELYARWRDSGIRIAKQLLSEEHKNVCILGLDVQEYYYHIRLDYSSIAQSIHEALVKGNDLFHSDITPSNLLRCLEAICVTYRHKIRPLFQISHRNVSPDVGIPIGLCSSPLLANWYLRRFDEAVMTLVRPAYYGRYVDDVLLVIPTPEDPSDGESPIAAFINRILVQSGILQVVGDDRYQIVVPGGLFLQREKCILQYFDAKHSIAGLQKFQKKLEENGSEFWLMPVDEADTSLEDVAYDILYEGSINKFRSVKAVSENRFELAKHMARQTILHLLTDDPPDPRTIIGIRQFFKGKNAIEYHDLWEPVLTFLLMAQGSKASSAFIRYLNSEIKRVQFRSNPIITERLVVNLKTHLVLCQSMSAGLIESVVRSPEDEVHLAASLFRSANLIRHHFVRLPLLNYTSYDGSLIARSIKTPVDLDDDKLRLSPRDVHFDECLLSAMNGDFKLKGQNPLQWARGIFKAINGREVQDIDWAPIEPEKEDESDGQV